VVEGTAKHKKLANIMREPRSNTRNGAGNNKDNRFNLKNFTLIKKKKRIRVYARLMLFLELSRNEPL